jgi:acyl carrier protein
LPWLFSPLTHRPPGYIRDSKFPHRSFSFSLNTFAQLLKEHSVTDTIISEIEKYIAAQILKQPNRKVTASEPLISSGLIDSFSLMDLALFVEDTFGVRIEDTELNGNTFDNLIQLASLIESRKA